MSAVSSPAPLWTADDIAEVLGLAPSGSWTASGVSIDSRTLRPGELFVAFAGPRHDGHDYVAAAFSAGAPAAIVAQAPAGLPKGDSRLIIVPDPLEALRRLGAVARARTRARVLAVTGSVGKTGTKEALRLVLGAHGATHANVGSFNNHIGVPLTLARLSADAAFAVFEIGMNHAGEITPLVGLVRPHIALVTNVEAVHLENFPDNGIDGIAEAKAEIFDGVGGETAVLNRDNTYFEFLAGRARDRGFHRVLSFGTHAEADARLVDVELGPMWSQVTAEYAGMTLSYRVGIPGRHWALNSLAVIAAAHAAGIAPEAAAAHLADLSAAKGRGQRHRVAFAAGAFELIDDSYNASPVSMQAAFAVLGASAPRAAGRRIAVLGDMLELGPESDAMHAGLALSLVASGVARVHTCGPHMARLHEALPPTMRGTHAKDSAALTPAVVADLRDGDVVLVKGSLGSRMAVVIEALMSLGRGARSEGRGFTGGGASDRSFGDGRSGQAAPMTAMAVGY